MDTLLNISGGIDSSYVAYKWLKDNPEKTLLLHYCSLRTNEKRWVEEGKAVKKVIKWLNANGYDNFEFIETISDVQQAKPKLWDITLLASKTGEIMSGYKTIEYVLFNTPKDEYDRLGSTIRTMYSRFDTVVNAVSRRRIKPISMLKDTYKIDIIKAMPQGLLELCWYCRRPKGKEPCHECHTCKQVDKAMEKLNETKK